MDVLFLDDHSGLSIRQVWNDMIDLTYSEQLQEELEPLGYIKAVADSMLSTRHPIYDCKFWIYEEKRLAPYDEYMDFYRRLENGSNNKS